MDLTTFLLPMAVKGLALAGVVVIACSALRHARGAVLHAVLAALFGALIALPILEAAGPAWQVPVVTVSLEAPPVDISAEDAHPYDALVVGAQSGEAVSSAATAPAARPASTDSAPAPRSAPRAAAFAAPVAASPGFSGESASGWTAYIRAPQVASWSLLILCAWGAGALLVGLYWAFALASAARVVRAAQPVTDADWLERLAHARRSLGHAGTVRLLQSERVSTPFAWGLGRPAVVLPASSGAWDAAARAAVLQHEVAHLARRDPHVQTVAQVALALHWFNPLAWAAYRRLLLARERACDDAALAAGVAPSAYAGLLLSVARLGRASARDPLALSAVPSMARPSELERRIVFVLDPDARRGGGTRSVRVALGLVVLAALVPLAAFRPVAEAAPAATAVVDARRAGAAASAVAQAGAPPSAQASARTATRPADPVRAAPSAPRPSAPSQQSPPAPPDPPAAPFAGPRPVPSQNNAGRGPGAADGSAFRDQEAVQASPTPAAPAAADPAGGVDWDAVTTARLAAEAALRQRLD